MAESSSPNQSEPRPHGDGLRPEAFGRSPQQDQKAPGKPAPPPDGQAPQGQSGQQGEPPAPGAQAKPNPPEKKPFWKRPVLLTVMALVAAAGIITGVIFYIHGRDFESTDDAFIDGRIVHVAPRVSGKVLELNVTDNEIVDVDTPLIRVDPKPYEVKVQQAKAALAQAEAQLDESMANLEVARATADQADADVIVATANANNAQRDYERYQKIDPAARSQQQLDNATAAKKSNDAQVTAAQKKADSMHAQAKAAEKTIEAAQASVQSAQAQLDDANLNLSYTTVVAGHKGRVTRRTVEVGNYVQVGQEILDVVPTDVPDGIWVTANFKETQLAHLERGQRVKISVDSYPDESLTGHIDSIQNGSGAVFSLLPAENATGNYVKVVQRVPVKIILDSQPRRLLSPGMSVEPEVDVRSHGSGSLADSTSRP